MSAEGAVCGGAGFDLIETMRWEPNQGFLRFERHLARLYGSARDLSFSYEPERIGQVLKDAIAEPDKALRVRLVLAQDGAVDASTQAYEALPPHKVWNLKFARVRVDSGETLLRHKTSRRAIYVKARSEHQIHQADEVLLLNERDEVCEGTITNIFADMGDDVFLTPPLGCGLLPGVLRAELLAEGRAREVVLGPHELMDAQRLFVGNSLRGLIPARMNE